MRQDVLFSKHNHVATLTLDRPPSNCIGRGMLAALRKAADKAAADDDVTVVVVTGGEKVFSEGIDIEEFRSMGTKERSNFVNLGQDVLLGIENMPKPTIAAMAGRVMGAGLEIALSCDLRVASEDAQFGHPELSQGLIPFFGKIARLENLVGASVARALVFFGEPVPAWEALEIGIVGKIVPAGALQEEARIAASRIARQPKNAVQAAKRAMSEARRKNEREALRATAKLLEDLLSERKTD